MTKAEAARLVAMLLAALPAAKASPGTSEVYETLLADLEYEPAQRALVLVLGSHAFAGSLPTVAEIREACATLKHGPVRPGGDAWGEVCDAIRRVGGHQPRPEFADPLVGECVDRFGWQALCWGDAVSDRARFIELYDSLARQQRLEQVTGVPLPRRLGAAFRPAPALPPTQGPERAATVKLDGKAGPLRVDLPKLPGRNPDAVWTGRRLTQAELDAELSKTGSDQR